MNSGNGSSLARSLCAGALTGDHVYKKIGQYTVRKQAAKAKTEAREAVELLEQAHVLMAKDDALQPAMKHLQPAIREAKARAALLEDWYWRTYS